ncbi:hypothetical protein AMTR_s00022p00015660 [Amborella trichopoda]|uniref:Uncharacterized protein n=1 Tax=Amborella trichopoda TaxID=13333 RepID=W1PU93_AMBTC|nr:hypothetical protein AMTR_s00022p00015660 [Amborella trichopoda]
MTLLWQRSLRKQGRRRSYEINAEAFNDMVAKAEKKSKRNMQEKEGKTTQRDFKF